MHFWILIEKISEGGLRESVCGTMMTDGGNSMRPGIDSPLDLALYVKVHMDTFVPAHHYRSLPLLILPLPLYLCFGRLALVESQPGLRKLHDDVQWGWPGNMDTQLVADQAHRAGTFSRSLLLPH